MHATHPHKRPPFKDFCILLMTSVSHLSSKELRAVYISLYSSVFITELGGRLGREGPVSVTEC